jgi:pyruvate/2-oxoglutarate/acetoin dehydrogenase E1 component
MYVDFTPLIIDQLANQGGKNRYMFGGKTSVPCVVRTEGGAGRSIAAHHSQALKPCGRTCPACTWSCPPLPTMPKVCSKPHSRRQPGHVHRAQNALQRERPRPEEDYIIPLGVADVKREGKDLTIVTYSRMVYKALEAAEILAKEGIDVEVIDLRSLKPLDIDTIITSIKKTGRFVGVTEAYENTSFISEIMAQINELAFDYLDAPMVRVSAANVPVPRAEILEDQVIPNTGRIVEACKRCCANG